MRLIDADALMEDLDKGLWGKEWDKALTETIINDAPTIDAVEKKVDVVRCNDCKKVEVVRCKDCKYRRTEDCPMCNECGKKAYPTADNDFCSFGEREGE